MTAKKAKGAKLTKADQRDIQELMRANSALKGTSHNPIEWAPIIKFLAPIIARIAARYAAKYIANRFGKRLKLSYSQDVADSTADKISEMVLTRIK